MHKEGPQEQNENDPHSNALPDGTAVTNGLELDSKLVSRPATPQRRSARSPAAARKHSRAAPRAACAPLRSQAEF